jgi:hypothetical protein
MNINNNSNNIVYNNTLSNSSNNYKIYRNNYIFMNPFHIFIIIIFVPLFANMIYITLNIIEILLIEIKKIFKNLYNRANRNKFTIELGSMEHKIIHK